MQSSEWVYLNNFVYGQELLVEAGVDISPGRKGA